MMRIIVTTVIGIIFLLADIIYLCPDVEKIIQTAPMIVLVFVTLYYAIETQILVKENEKKRIADFYEKRIDEFYSPFFIEFEDILNIMDSLYFDGKQIEDVYKIKSKISLLIELHNNKAYMLSNTTSEKLKEWLFKYSIGTLIQLFKMEKGEINFRNEIVDILKLFKNEKIDIDDNIREIYGYLIKSDKKEKV